jgi:histidinol-phosphate aminotransferase
MHDGWNRMRPVMSPNTDFHEMSLNETYFPPLPGVAEAVADSAAQAHRTLDAMSAGLTSAIADQLGVPPGNVLAGPGSGALLQQLFSALTSGDTETVHAWPSWEAYPMMASNAGSRVIRVPLRDNVHDLDAMAAAVTPATRLVLVCNPNNPTGTVVGHEQVRRFLGLLPEHVTVVLDEAYGDFAAEGAMADGIALFREDPRVCVVRTFSKSYGLLSLRVGYLVAHDDVLARLRGISFFIRVSNAAQNAARAALSAQDELRRRCAEISAERDRLRAGLLAQGWPVSPSEANFLWLDVPDDAEKLTRFCADRGVLICGKPGEGVRVTIAERAADDAFLRLAGEFREAVL